MKRKAYPQKIEIPVNFTTTQGSPRKMYMSLKIDERCTTDDYEDVRKAVIQASAAMVNCFKI